MKALCWGTGSQALQGARLGMGTDPGEGYRKRRRDGGSGAPGKEPPGEWGVGGREVTSGEGGVKSSVTIKVGRRSEATLNKEMALPL